MESGEQAGLTMVIAERHRMVAESLDRMDAQLTRNEEVTFGFTLHDVGKIGIPDAILSKPGPLVT